MRVLAYIDCSGSVCHDEEFSRRLAALDDLMLRYPNTKMSASVFGTGTTNVGLLSRFTKNHEDLRDTVVDTLNSVRYQAGGPMAYESHYMSTTAGKRGLVYLLGDGMYPVQPYNFVTIDVFNPPAWCVRTTLASLGDKL